MIPTLPLAELGQRIVDDGPAAHHLLLEHLASLAADAVPGAATALSDPVAPDAVRQRAFAIVSAALLRLSDTAGTQPLSGFGRAA
jgi:hypothetical protein